MDFLSEINLDDDDNDDDDDDDDDDNLILLLLQFIIVLSGITWFVIEIMMSSQVKSSQVVFIITNHKWDNFAVVEFVIKCWL